MAVSSCTRGLKARYSNHFPLGLAAVHLPRFHESGDCLCIVRKQSTTDFVEKGRVDLILDLVMEDVQQQQKEADWGTSEGNARRKKQKNKNKKTKRKKKKVKTPEYPRPRLLIVIITLAILQTGTLLAQEILKKRRFSASYTFWITKGLC